MESSKAVWASDHRDAFMRYILKVHCDLNLILDRYLAQVAETETSSNLKNAIQRSGGALVHLLKLPCEKLASLMQQTSFGFCCSVKQNEPVEIQSKVIVAM